MLHPLFLNFKDEQIESEYRESQTKQLKEDFQAISLIIMLMGSAIIILIISLEKYYIAMFGSVGILIIPVFRYLVEENSNNVNFIYPILQITISLILNGLIMYLPETLIKYNWYFGLLAGVLHLGVFMQGTVLCYQSWTLIGIFIWHIYNIGFDNQINSLMSLSLGFILAVLIYIRRSYQRNNRTFYLEFRENFKWFSIVDKIVKTKITLISFDKKQDQIQLVQATQSFYANHQFMTQKEFRNHIRAIKVKQLNMKEQTLETIIRQMLNKKEKYKSKTQILKDKLYYIYTGYSNIYSNYYKIQLIDYYQADKKMVIAIFSDIQIKCPNQQIQNILQRNYIKYLAFQGLKSFRILLENKFVSAKNYIIPYLQFYITNIWLNPNILIDKKLIVKINFTEINILLQQIYQCSKIKMHQPEFILFNSRDVILIIFVTFFELFSQTKQILNCCEIKSKSKFNIQYWKVIFKFNKLQLHENIVEYCKTNVHFNGFQYFQFKTQEDIEQNINKISNHMSYVGDLFKLKDQRSIFLSLGLPIVKFLLQHYGLTNKIQIKGNSISFTLINFLNLPNKN